MDWEAIFPTAAVLHEGVRSLTGDPSPFRCQDDVLESIANRPLMGIVEPPYRRSTVAFATSPDEPDAQIQGINAYTLVSILNEMVALSRITGASSAVFTCSPFTVSVHCRGAAFWCFDSHASGHLGGATVSTATTVYSVWILLATRLRIEYTDPMREQVDVFMFAAADPNVKLYGKSGTRSDYISPI
jgi:hypothetical protein